MNEGSSDGEDPFEWVSLPSDSESPAPDADDERSSTTAAGASPSADGDWGDSFEELREDAPPADSTPDPSPPDSAPDPSPPDSTPDSSPPDSTPVDSRRDTDWEPVRVGLRDVPSEPLGGWDAVPDEPPESADDGDQLRNSRSSSPGRESLRSSSPGRESPRSDGTTAESESVALPAPPAAWRDSDPTGAGWWRVLYRGTQLSLLVLLSWSVPVAALDLTTELAPPSVSLWGAVGLIGLTVVAALLRLVVLPVALYRDATLLGRRDEVAWSPSRRFYLLVGAIFATGTCLYYLYKRGRHVGNPRIPLGSALVRYEGQSVASNWWLMATLAVAVGTITGGLSSLVSPLPVPVTAARVAVGGPFFSVTGAQTALAAVGTLPSPVDVAVGAPALAAGGTAVVLRLVVLPVAFYNDATAVRRSDAPWDPLALWYALAGWVFAVPTALVYLVRRLQYTDVSLSADAVRARRARSEETTQTTRDDR